MTRLQRTASARSARPSSIDSGRSRSISALLPSLRQALRPISARLSESSPSSSETSASTTSTPPRTGWARSSARCPVPSGRLEKPGRDSGGVEGAAAPARGPSRARRWPPRRSAAGTARAGRPWPPRGRCWWRAARRVQPARRHRGLEDREGQLRRERARIHGRAGERPLRQRPVLAQHALGCALAAAQRLCQLVDVHRPFSSHAIPPATSTGVTSVPRRAPKIARGSTPRTRKWL